MARENLGQNRLAAEIGSLKGLLAEGNDSRINAENIVEGNEPLRDSEDHTALGILNYLHVIAQSNILLLEIAASKEARKGKSQEIFSGSDGTGN